MKRATVHDIAAEAGVSLATVDRVINQRPGVRHQTMQRVAAAISKLDYVRDHAAANLARRFHYKLTFILPTGANSFMDLLEQEISAAAAIGTRSRTEITLMRVPAFDSVALAKCLNNINPDSCHGVVLVATDSPDVRMALSQLRDHGVRVVTLVSDVATNHRDYYAGIDNVAAGRTAARLMGHFVRSDGQVAIIAGSMLVKDHTERRFGFEQVIRQDFPALEILPAVEGFDDPAEVSRLTLKLLADHPDIVGLYSLGAGTRGLLKILRQARAHRPVRAIAHELTSHARAALLDGTLDAVINQDAKLEVANAIGVVRALVDGEELSKFNQPTPIEVYLKDNLP
jgi:LacI family transcriptional regulator